MLTDQLKLDHIFMEKIRNCKGGEKFCLISKSTQITFTIKIENLESLRGESFKTVWIDEHFNETTPIL